MSEESGIRERLRRLEEHLRKENPLLEGVVASFRELDWVSRRIGFFGREDSHATRAAWWPLISVLGIYSSGKSTFINHYLKYALQTTGNQAVDEKFTVICFSSDDTVRLLPGLALDADPRFPLYKISEAIEDVATGQGQRIDAYLQLKSCPSEKVRGKIFIDSPGFDADAQRTSTLRITNHIVDLSDLVLVFFDARHPEAGSMQETLEHLVNGTIHRRDSNKFLYILNQIDATANEDNPEDVFAAWQRALAQYGLTAGRCYSIYNPEAAIEIKDERLRQRFETKRDADMKEIYNRIEQVRVERAYRIAGMLEEIVHSTEREIVSRLRRFRQTWRRRLLWFEGGLLAAILVALLGLVVWSGSWDGLLLKMPFVDQLRASRHAQLGLLIAAVLVAGYIHYMIRQWTAKRVTRKFLAEIKDQDLMLNYARALRKNTRWWRPFLTSKPAGWGRPAARRLARVVDEANAFIQKLNDEYTNPSGEEKKPPAPEPPAQLLNRGDVSESAEAEAVPWDAAAEEGSKQASNPAKTEDNEGSPRQG